MPKNFDKQTLCSSESLTFSILFIQKMIIKKLFVLRFYLLYNDLPRVTTTLMSPFGLDLWCKSESLKVFFIFFFNTLVSSCIHSSVYTMKRKTLFRFTQTIKLYCHFHQHCKKQKKENIKANNACKISQLLYKLK